MNQYARIKPMGLRMEYLEEGKPPIVYKERILLADPAVAEVFSFDFILGDPQKIIQTKSEIALSESLALKLFGEESPIGKTIIADSEFHLTVTGIYKDLPSNSTIKMPALINIKLFEDVIQTPGYLESWDNWGLESYVVLPEKFNQQALIQKLKKELYAAYDISEDTDKEIPFRLAPFSEIYFSKIDDFWQHGNRNNLFLFSAISIFILLIACINFINITTAHSTLRAREVGLKKVVGAQKKQLCLQFLTETLILSYLAVLVAITLTELLLPIYSQLVETTIQMQYSFRNLLILLVALPVILSILAGLYPSIVLSSFKVSHILKGEYVKGQKGGFLQKSLTIVQFAIGIFLIVGTIGLYKQMDYIQKKDPGYEKEHIVYLSTNQDINKQFDSFKQELKKNPNIIGITRSNGHIQDLGQVWTLSIDNYNNITSCFWVDSDFVPTMGLTILKGRNFNEGEADLDKTLLINKELASKYFPDGALGKTINDREVIGVVKNFNYTSLHSKIEPLTIGYTSEFPNLIPVRLSGNDLEETLNYIEKQWGRFAPSHPFTYGFLDSQFDHMYKEDQRYLKLFLIFSGLAIFLACMGLFAMAAFIAERKTKEIGVRKVLGASEGRIALLLSKSFTRWVVFANLLAWPVAYYFLKKWLSNFAYHIQIEWYFFFIGAIFALFIAQITILSHTLKTARKNPLESLKYE
jgi:putative ABC transport system permease protein